MRTPTGRQLVVIGGGATAVAVLHALPPEFRAASVTVVDPRPVGLGLAFGTADPRLRCNTSLDVTSLSRGATSDLQRYLAERGWPAGRADFVPRALVGQYCRERWTQFRVRSERQGITVRHVAARAREVARAASGPGYTVALGDGRALPADDVVVAVGGERPVVPGLLRPHLGEERLLAGPYPTDRLRALPPGSRVLMIGSKLSAIDAALVLCGTGRHVTMSSPSGTLPAVRHRLWRSPVQTGLLTALRDLDPAAPDFGTGLTRILLRAVRDSGGRGPAPARGQYSEQEQPLDRLVEDLALTEAGANLWQDIVAEFIEAVNDWTLGWPVAERDSLFRRHGALVSRYVSAIPAASATRLVAYGKDGLLRVRQGLPETLDRTADGWAVQWADGSREPYTHVVAAAGFQPPALCTHAGPLLRIGGAEGCPLPATGPDLRLDGERVWLAGAATGASTAIVNYLWTAARQAEVVASALSA